MMLRDAVRLDPATVKLWNGEKWTRVLGWSRTARKSDELEIVLRSGERISCTPSHQFPTQRGLLRAGELQIGDLLTRVPLPEPDEPKDSAHVSCDAAWLAGLYLAEGSRSGYALQISGHIKEEERWRRVKQIVESYGGTVTRTLSGNKMDIRAYGAVVCSVIDHFICGTTAKNKGLTTRAWRYSNAVLLSLLEGYLSGDGAWDQKNNRWRLGFTRNYALERDLRALAARLSLHLVLKLSTTSYQGGRVPTFRGELRFERSGHWNQRETCEVAEIRKARCREVYDVGVEDEPRLFALASGILTHNSKPNCMPESVRDRPTRSHEYIFMLTKSERYYYDTDAIAEPLLHPDGPWGGRTPRPGVDTHGGGQASRDGFKGYISKGTRNKRSVWRVPTKPFRGAHFATFPPALIEPCILASTSERGVCGVCGASWRRRRERTGHENRREPTHTPNNAPTKTDSTGWAPVTRATEEWMAGCSCSSSVQPATVLDPFCGAGTALLVAAQHGRQGIGVELNPDYARMAEHRLLQAGIAVTVDGLEPRLRFAFGS